MLLSMRQKYYIEFVGAHSAGKTSAYHAIALQNMLTPHRAIYPGQIHRSWLHFALSIPSIAIRNSKDLFFIILFFLLHARWCGINYRVMRSLLKMVILHPYYYRFDFDIFLKDDMLHLLPRIIFKNGTNLEHVMRVYFMHFIHLYDGLIYIDITPELMRERFRKRFSEKSVSFQESRQCIHERVLKQNVALRNVIVNQNRVPYLLLNGARDPQENAQKVVDFIHEYIIKH